MVRFPALADPFDAPMRVEADIRGVQVTQGEIPEQLSGTYYKCVVDRQWPSFIENDLELFNSDGMVISFRFDRGRVDFKSRYVRTPRFQAEEIAGRALFGAYRNPYTDNPTVEGLSRGLANTNVFYHGGRLYVAKEDSAPLILDPVTLETLGEFDFEGSLTSQTSTAHPKFDPRTGEMVFFGYAAKGDTTPDIVYYEADAAGRLVHETWFQAPYSSMVHDFVVTQNFVVFPIIPLKSDLQWLKNGESHFKWDPNEDVYLGVLPRRGSAADVRWYKGSNRFASHMMGGYDDGRFIHIDTPVSATNYFPWFPDLCGASYDPERAKGYLSRWTVDTHDPSMTFTQKQLSQLPGEFPRMDDRQETLPYTWGVMGLTDVPGRTAPGGGFRWVSAIELDTGKQRIYYPGDHATVGEPLFVPAKPDSPPGVGYVFVVVARRDRMHSDLVILDAQKLDEPPVCTLSLPMRIRMGLHGNWVSSEELAHRTA
ncbi:carotenoid oxygenase family protein [Phytoactinopolyspora endophytica]|uniref:carotenoid oxygenase family protein n=1 Tax=Phytoactinopolyspora endophytica TaxID=1642495 RepID=UPI00101C15C6|nr:carotenoid oxygenase family protein [Phytoactinopolyspora endophytica]